MAIIDHDEARAALVAVLQAALDDLDPPFTLRVRDSRLIDVEEEVEAEVEKSGRYQVSQVDGTIRELDFMQGSPPTYDVLARFHLMVEGVALDDATREARVSVVRKAATNAVVADPRLGGQVTYARPVQMDPQDLKEEGMAGDTMAEVTIEVEFVSLSPIG